LKTAAYLGALLGVALLIALGVRSDLGAMLYTLGVAGWQLLWLVPYRGLYFILYAVGWYLLLRPYDPSRAAGFGYVLWVTTVREAIDRLLPVATVGGSVAGVRLMSWRGIGKVPATATVVVEILLTLSVLYAFTALGLVLLANRGAGDSYQRLLVGFLCSLPVPIVTAALLSYGSVFGRLQRVLSRVAGVGVLVESAAKALDDELHACLRRGGTLLVVGSLQLIAWISGAFEVWFVLRIFGHPVGVSAALILESTMQALRHLAFLVPAGIGVQEASLVMFGHLLGISSEQALGVSMAKRIREVLCGLPPLLSWQWLEGLRLAKPGKR
jgi:putative membrane protein